jgi:hypothetical protein
MYHREGRDISDEQTFKLSEMSDLYFWEPVYFCEKSENHPVLGTVSPNSVNSGDGPRGSNLILKYI